MRTLSKVFIHEKLVGRTFLNASARKTSQKKGRGVRQKQENKGGRGAMSEK